MYKYTFLRSLLTKSVKRHQVDSISVYIHTTIMEFNDLLAEVKTLRVDLKMFIAQDYDIS